MLIAILHSSFFFFFFFFFFLFPVNARLTGMSCFLGGGHG
tara:strand:- start:139 stop:258 length:120 start_codon:yes stop_codon:yes gene_type:complete